MCVLRASAAGADTAYFGLVRLCNGSPSGKTSCGVPTSAEYVATGHCELLAHCLLCAATAVDMGLSIGTGSAFTIGNLCKHCNNIPRIPLYIVYTILCMSCGLRLRLRRDLDHAQCEEDNIVFT